MQLAKLALKFTLAALIFLPKTALPQPNFTANDTIRPYSTGFLAGANPGIALGFADEGLADFAAGNPERGINGAGAQTLRPGLTETFFEQYGYDIRLPAFQHFEKLGLRDHTVIVGFPSDAHRDPNFYCPDHRSTLFSNLYEPIWDGGANGTPVNEQNHAATYFWKMATRYKNYLKFYEIWNEPGFDYTSLHGFSEPGSPGNWWDADPSPCDYKLRAPIQHYVRLLRIAWEVIKTADPEAYILCGGVGYPSFLDAILRNTDNPDGGKTTPDFPLGGGAYFDAVGYHSYPHFDSSVRTFNDSTMSFDYFRHSDGAAAGITVVKNRFVPVLKKHGYDGSKFPEKLWLVTEINVPRLEFEPHRMGSELLQRNFMIKAFVECARQDFAAMHVYSLAEEKRESKATFEFDVMGLYRKLDVQQGVFQQKNEAAVALKTVSDLLTGLKFDAAKTADLNLPATVGGAVFKDLKTKRTTFVLWAKTSIDRSEYAAASFNFPIPSSTLPMLRRDWDFSKTGISTAFDPKTTTLELDATPVFFTETLTTISTTMGCVPLEIELDGMDFPILWEEKWLFPDGSPVVSTTGKLTATYLQTGEFEIVHQFVHFASGQVDFEEKIKIKVEEPPTANFETDPSSAGGYFHFKNLSAPNADSFVWDFGDGKNSAMPNPDHIFSSDGNFEVKLTAQNECGESIFSKNFQINAPDAPAPLDFTAIDTVADFQKPFRAGTIFKSPAGWTDEKLADIAAGNLLTGDAGTGVRTGKFLLPQYFLDFWGTDIRSTEFQHYKNLNLDDNIAVLGFPNDAARETWRFCPTEQSVIFKNIYADIWDGGANGTAVNEENPFASYVWKTVSEYRDQVQFWQVYDAPDFDLTGKYGWLPPGEPENWWQHDPEPCVTSTRAPIQTYIRLLRITYEIVKTLDPDGYVLLGGVGYPSFLDALLRNSDNPDGGKISQNFPHGGGAYFDALGFNSYPFVDGSTSFFDSNSGGFVFQRHSDAAAEGIFKTQQKFSQVLENHGFDGKKHPAKKWIVTEANTPRKRFGDFFGGEIEQRNYLVKAMVEAAANGFLQFNSNRLSEAKQFAFAAAPDDLMGLFSSLENVPQGSESLTPGGVAFSTASQILFNTKFDAARTALLNLPPTVAGFAFCDAAGGFVYVLWAKTSQDLSENASASFSFPNSLNINSLYLKNWDWAATKNISSVAPTGIQLTASPIFLTENLTTPQPPLAVFIASKTVVCAPATVQFSSLSANADSLVWHFENGQPATSTEPNPTVVFPNIGKFEVSLTAKNAAGSHTASISKFVEVRGLPTADFSIEVEYQTVRFKNLSENIDSVQWILHDGAVVKAWNFERFYFDNGSFPVSLVVFDGCGSDTLTKNVIISASPVAAFNLILPQKCGEFYAAFQNFSGSSPDSIFWFLPGATPSFSTDNDVWATFPGFGNYLVTLVVKNQFGSDTLTKTFQFLEEIRSQTSPTICENEQVEVLGQVFSAANPTGEIRLAGAAAGGCDSVIEVSLNFLPTRKTEIFDTATVGQAVNFCGQNLAAAGDFECVLTAENGCDSVVVLHLTMLASDDEPLEKLHFQVFPNPFSDKIFVEWRQPWAAPIEVFLENSLGQIVFQFFENQTVVSGRPHLTVELPTGLPAGVFWLRLRSGAFFGSEKLIKN